ncbi:hypothetical protein ACH9D2_05160 [Kocuria sp. M4R2S49]|uniref:hypothetical protein n=1 Tax=Kocuria rhizosphaericola TaxID=3376284 RepID=UPI00379A7392
MHAPIWFGDSTHHTGFPGSLGVSAVTLSLLVRDIGRSLARLCELVEWRRTCDGPVGAGPAARVLPVPEWCTS